MQNLRHLRLLIETDRRGGLGKAAEVLNLSHSAATQAIQRIEAEYCVRLCDRGRAGARLTEAGAILAERGRRALAWLNAADAELAKARGRDPGTPIAERATAAQLRALIAVCTSESYTLAARSVGLSQPSIHRAVRQFEARSGVPLFRPAPWGIEPVPLARHMARCASLAFAELDRGREEIQAHQGHLTGHLAIGSLPFARTEIVPLAVTRILDRFPHASVEIFDGSYRELLDELRHGRIDLIVGALRDPAPTREIVQEPLFVDRLSVILGPHHPLAGRPDLSDADIAGLGWIVSRKGTPARRQFEEFLRRRKLPVPDNVIECGSLVAVRGLLTHGLRATLLSERQVSYELRHGLLARAGQPMAGTERTIGLTWRAQDRPTPMQAAFADLLRTISLGQVH